jgi:hypothetical protein
MARIDWGRALDFETAKQNLRAEQPGDWHHDPWGWPEYDFLVRKEPQLLHARCDARGTFRSALIDVPKENWGSRPAVVLDIADRLTYQALVDKVSVDLIGEMAPDVYGWRLPPVTPQRGVYSHNNIQWDGYTGHLKLLSALHTVALRTDLVSFFASIPTEPVQEAIQDRTRKGAVTNRLCDLVEGFQSTPSRSGLPQRSSASSVIANMYLAPVDDVLIHHSRRMLKIFGSKIQYRSFARWMDDIWLMGDDPAAARKAQMDLQAAASDLGLNLNSAKTEVLEGEAVAEKALQIEHSAVDDGILAGDLEPLEQLVDHVLDGPETAGRTSVKFLTKRMRDNHVRYRVQDMAVVAARMPHVSDAWSRLFKEAFTHASLQDWFLDYAKSDWAAHEWSVAHFIRMFPSQTKPRKPLREFVAAAVRDANTSLPLLAVAAQRLTAWDPEEGRAACRDAFSRSPNAHTRRVIALSAIGAGETRTLVRRWLNADEENVPTKKMLEEYGFVPPKVQRDFAD